MLDNSLTILTPTTGKKSLYRLIESIERQNVHATHILLWDDKREDEFLYPDAETMRVKQPTDLNNGNRYSVVVPGSLVQGKACGSSLRAVGLMLANTPFVMFADDDVFYDTNCLKTMLELVNGKQWAYCRRRIWANSDECIGLDNFESVGNSPDRKVSYEMVDNNCMIFSRRLGSSGAVLYRETKEYNDDRLFYDFLKQYGGSPGVIKSPIVNQICPNRLIPMFKKCCDQNNE